MSCASLMMQGTTSDAGKSSLVALLDVEVDFVARREADLNRFRCCRTKPELANDD